MNTRFVNSIADIPEQTWQQLNNSDNPFTQYNFFTALEQSGSATKQTGWQAQHLIFESNNAKNKQIEAILPCYIKSHSWGEYVFDWAWADAYQRYQLEYYPKLVATIPFSPISSNKLFSAQHNLLDVLPILTKHCLAHNLSSWHILFDEHIAQIADKLPDDIYLRYSVQFHWFNQNYQSFDDFLQQFKARKRKNTLKERNSIIEQGIKIRRLQGKDITPEELKFFYLTYQITYAKNGHQPHLSFAFFQQLLANMTDNILLVIASDQNNNDIACAWFMNDDTTLYGRYWGCTQHVANLHFELCYYQGIEYAIEQKLQCFNPGTQGEHKIQRGFKPILTQSLHWIAHQGFKPAIHEFCQQEQKQMQYYQQQCREKLPFKQI